MYADLHVHSRYSDGTLTPLELAEEAARNGVSLLALADHDEVRGSLEIAPLLLARGIGYLSAVEHSCLFGGRFYHVLSYGADLADANLLAVVRQSRAALDGMSDALIERMAHDQPVSAREYHAFEHDPRVGGWKGVEYLWRKGLADTIQQAQGFYKQYDVRYEHADFPQMSALLDAVHAAGGVCVLAHPGEMIDKTDMEAFARTLAELLDAGLDGAECYYPLHENWVRDVCFSLCNQRALLVTAGSDCHGAFGKARVGQMDVPVSALRLGKLGRR